MSAFRFFLFLCSVCNNGGEERLTRLSQEITLADMAHIALFNLTIETAKKYHDLDMSVLPFIENNWKYFQPSNEVYISSGSTVMTNIFTFPSFILVINVDSQWKTDPNSSSFLAVQKSVTCVWSGYESVSVNIFYPISFMCGRELKKKKTMWGLRFRLPSPFPSVLSPQSQHMLQLWTNRDLVSSGPSIEWVIFNCIFTFKLI